MVISHLDLAVLFIIICRQTRAETRQSTGNVDKSWTSWSATQRIGSQEGRSSKYIQYQSLPSRFILMSVFLSYFVQIVVFLLFFLSCKFLLSGFHFIVNRDSFPCRCHVAGRTQWCWQTEGRCGQSGVTPTVSVAAPSYQMKTMANFQFTATYRPYRMSTLPR